MIKKSTKEALMRHKILIVDDVDVNRSILSLMFEAEYEILEAENGKVAMDLIEKYMGEIAVILLDLHMPVVSGFEVLENLCTRNLIEKIPVILITGDNSHESEREGYEYGVSDIIHKPFDPHIVSTRVKNVIELYQHKNHLEELVKEQTVKIVAQSERLKEMNRNVIDTLSTMVEFRNLESGQHIIRIRSFTKVILECLAKYYPEYGLNDEKIDTIAFASVMHDVGKIAIPDGILLKPGRLTNDEFEVMKTHTLKGCDIVKAITSSLNEGEEDDFYKYCYDICRHHHERYDGNGYPDRLSGEEIPIAAQAVSIADVYDALVSERVYKNAFSPDEAYEMIINGECGIFSPKILTCFKMSKQTFEQLVDKNKEM